MLIGAAESKQNQGPPILRFYHGQGRGNKFHSACPGDRAAGCSALEPSVTKAPVGSSPWKQDQSEKARRKQVEDKGHATVAERERRGTGPEQGQTCLLVALLL